MLGKPFGPGALRDPIASISCLVLSGLGEEVRRWLSSMVMMGGKRSGSGLGAGFIRKERTKEINKDLRYFIPIKGE